MLITYLASLTLLIVTPYKDIGEKIWKNECGGIIGNLTCWNQGENFASLGIGHFIWHTESNKGPFEETFPELLHFLETQGEILPHWLKENPSCPWQTREEFYEQFQSDKMKELRDFLLKTKDLQALFMKKRLEKSLPQMTVHLSSKEKAKVMKNFQKLSKTDRGMYALIDYLNFKGSGISYSESYQGHRWGLLQVLLTMRSSGDEIEAFVLAAQKILTLRVELSPPERNEKRWLTGWLNRLNTYNDK